MNFDDIRTPIVPAFVRLRGSKRVVCVSKLSDKELRALARRWADDWIALANRLRAKPRNNRELRRENAALRAEVESQKAQFEANHEWEACAENEAIALRAEVERLREKLSRVADWIRYAANSPGGIVAEVEEILAGREKEESR